VKVLVTGGSGFMGSNYIFYLVEHAKERNVNWVYNYSKETYAVHNHTLEELRGKMGFWDIEGDILDVPRLYNILNNTKIDWVVHFAAETHVDRSFKYPEEFIQTNIVGTYRMLEALRYIDKKRRPKLIHISTDEVFGDVSSGHCTEDTILKPQNPYSGTKAAIESLLHAWRVSYGMDIRIIRPTNNYGPRQHPEKLIAKIITRCLDDRPFTLWKGHAIRNWLYVGDLCKAIDFVMDRGRSGESYNVSSSDDLTVNQIKDIILKTMEKKHLFEGYKGQRLKLDQRYALNCDKLRKLGWRQSTRFIGGILTTIDWYKSNPWFWEGAWSQ